MKIGRVIFVFKRDMFSCFGVIFCFGNLEDVRWFEVNFCYIYYIINVWEEGDEIVMDCCVNDDFILQKEFLKGVSVVEKFNEYF